MMEYEFAAIPSPEENARLIRQADLHALVYEKAGYERKLEAARAVGNEAEIKLYTQQIKDVEDVLELAGAQREPRTKIRK